jgi:histidyl-tRNA synthetase
MTRCRIKPATAVHAAPSEWRWRSLGRRALARLAPMAKYQAPRGTRDLLPTDMLEWHRLQTLAADLSARYGYRPIETPLFEDSAVFERAIGAATDVVEKELFRVLSPGADGARWALRPEATAGVARAYIEHGMHTLLQPVRLTTFGPMFRYDRPQAGRYRQFWQWNVEAIGDPGPAVDAEIIELGLRFLREAGVPDVEIHLNSIGDPACRPEYVAALVQHVRSAGDALPAAERARLESNPLRLLDSKDERTLALLAEAPAITDFLCAECREHHELLQHHLESLQVPVRPAPRLVRGLDYYTRTAFEYYRRGAEGQQQALGGGGRYDGLLELLGARATPGIGFAIGIDRVVLLSNVEAPRPRASAPLAVVVGADAAATDLRLRVATDLRAAGLPVSAELGQRKLGRQLEGAARQGAHFAIVVGDELKAGQVQLRDLEAGTQRLVNVAELARELQRAAGSHRHG